MKGEKLTSNRGTDNAYFETVYTGGDTNAENVARVHMYPFDQVKDTCKSGRKVAAALRDAFDVLLNHIDGYEVLRFKTGMWTEPDGHIDFSSSIKKQFIDYLKFEAASYNGASMYKYVGAHQLIHPNQNACNETSEGYAPDGAGGEGSSADVSAFNTGLAAWSPVCDYNDSLTKSAAAQECLHMHIAHNRDDQWTGTNDDQHTLGRLIYGPNQIVVTPLFTYHWDDDRFDLGNEGDCSSNTTQDPDTHSVIPTSCTKDAIKNTAENSN